MQAIYSFILSILEFFRMWIGLLFPLVRSTADFRTWTLPFRIFVWVMVVGTVCFLLWLLERNLTGFPDLLPTVPFIGRNSLYLCLIFLTGHALCWVIYKLMQNLSDGVTNIEYPDIDDAWRTALLQLEEEGVNITELPMFLVLGSSASGDKGFFEGAGMSKMLIAPGKGQPPVRLIATPKAIYVMASGVSAWSTYCNLLNNKDTGVGNAEEVTREEEESRKTQRFTSVFTAENDEGKDIAREIQELLRKSAMGTITEDEQIQLRELSSMTTGKPKEASNKVPEFPSTRQKLAHRRLRYLCKLMLRDRRPWCPINGSLVLIPWKLLHNDDYCREAPNFLLRDLTIARDTLTLHAPVHTLLCDVETAIGFDQFRDCFRSKTVLTQRFGQKSPLMPSMSGTELPAFYESLAAWLGQTLMPKWILQFLNKDLATDSRNTPGMATNYNSSLYSFMREMYMRAPRLGRVLKQGVVLSESSSNPEPMPLFGGCYLAATGESENQQAFLPGVFDRLVDNQNSVAWTKAALASERKYYGYTMLGYFASLVCVVLGVVLIWYLMKSKT